MDFAVLHSAMAAGSYCSQSQGNRLADIFLISSRCYASSPPSDSCSMAKLSFR